MFTPKHCSRSSDASTPQKHTHRFGAFQASTLPLSTLAAQRNRRGRTLPPCPPHGCEPGCTNLLRSSQKLDDRIGLKTILLAAIDDAEKVAADERDGTTHKCVDVKLLLFCICDCLTGFLREQHRDIIWEQHRRRGTPTDGGTPRRPASGRREGARAVKAADQAEGSEEGLHRREVAAKDARESAREKSGKLECDLRRIYYYMYSRAVSRSDRGRNPIFSARPFRQIDDTASSSAI